jgi:hypothetical protein
MRTCEAHTRTNVPPSFGTQEPHYEHIFPHFNGLRTWDASGDEPLQVSHLLFRPQSDHLAWIAPAVSTLETSLSTDVAISILED